MKTPPVADRDQRSELAREARRGEILAAARRVVAVRGFRGTTIADIAEEAEIALGTIYLYFTSKESVFAALNQQLRDFAASRDKVTNFNARFYVSAQAPERRSGLKSVPFFNNAKHTRASLRSRATKAAVVLMPRARSDR